MPPETELIKQQMGQTRAALTDKLETLENKVLGTVSSTSDTVTRTVHEVGDTVQETAQNLRATLRESIDSVRDALDVSQHINQHPWIMVGGSVVAGYVSGVMLDNLERGHWPSLAAAEQLLPERSELRQRIQTEAPRPHRVPGFLKALAESFAPELEKLKVAAVGMALGVVRDKISQSVPPHLRTDFADMMDRITTKLGGEPRPSNAFYGYDQEQDETNGARQAGPIGMG